MSLNKVNVAMVENNTIVKTDVLRAEKAGTAVKIKAVKGAKYILAEGDKGYAPENITVKRVGKDLHVMLEGTDENQPQLIIEDFFANPGELVGKAEDGQWHEYISSDGDSDHEAAFLMDGESSALVLGAGAIGSLDGLALAPFALSPALLALGALAGILAAAGLATAIAHNRDNGGDHGGSDGGDGGGEGGGGIGPVIKAPVWSEVVDDQGDFQGPIQNGGLTDDNTPTFGGTGTPGNTIIIRDKGEVIGSTIVGEDGSWTWTPENPLPDGEHHITPVERDEHGNESVPGEEFVVIIDTDPPARPEIGQVFDDVEPKMGPVANGGYTNDDTPTFSGEGQTPGDTIIIIDNGKEIGSVIVGEDGSWSYTPDEPFKDGDHNIEIVARDPAGNRSETSDPWLVIVDTEIPGKPGTGTTGGLDDIIDDVGPVTGSIAKGGVTDDSTPTLEGSHQRPGTIVTIIDNGKVIGSTVADANGGWRFTPPELPAGEHSFSIIIETPTGYISPESDPWLVVIDLEAPEAPVIKEIIDDQGAVTGPINNGDVTDDAQPTISGTAEAGSTVIIYDKGVEIGRAQADDQGNWSFTPVPPLQNGDHEISAKAQDKAGNIGDASNSIGFELIAGGNATAPSIVGAWDDVEAFTGLLQSGAKTNDARPELRGTAPAGETVTIIMDGKVQGTAIADGKGQWSWTPAADIPDGTHNFRAETRDDAGNPAATGNFQLVIDTDAPDAATGIVADDNVGPIVGPISSGDTTDDSTPTFKGEGEAGATVIVKDGDDVIGSTIVGDDGRWEFTPAKPLPDGEHSLVVVIRDEAGNESAPSDPIDFIVDTGNVVISIDYAYDDVEAHTGNLAAGSVTNDDTPTLHGKATANSIVTIMNGDVVLGSVKTDSFGRWSFTTPALQDGSYSFTATATNAKTGVISAPTAEFNLVIDTEAPTKPGEGGTGGDGIGDVIDDVGPIRGSVKPGDVTDDTTPTLEGSGLQKDDVVSIIDNGEVIGSAVADENGGWQFTPNPPLNPGEHEFTIIVTDPAGNRSEPSDPYLIVVDTEAPAAPVIKEIIDDQGAVTGPINNGDTTDDAQPTISGTAEAGSTVIIYDRGVEIGRAQADDQGNWSFTPVPPLQNGDHEISAKAQDKAGNIGDASNSIGFELIAGGNATAPSIVGAWDDVEAFTGLLQSGAKTNDARPELRGTAPAGETVTIIMDGRVQGTVIADGKGQWSWTPAADIPDGTHNFRAETRDDAGNPAATGNFQLVIDTDAPDAATGIVADDNVGPIVGPIGDGDTTDDSTPTIGGEGEPGGTVIVKDGDDVIGSTIVGDDGRWEFTPAEPLPDGEHEIIVVIRDEAGNESAPSDPIKVIVDTGDVVISIDYAYDDVEAGTGNLAAGSVTNDDTPTLHGRATANSIVTIMNGDVVLGSVKTDSFGRWSFTTPALQDGHYSFTATATDAKTGAISAPTAEFALDIDTQAPTKPGEGGTGGDGIGDVIDDVGPIRGSVKPGDVTDDTTPTLEGSGLQKDDVVSIIDNGEVIGTAVADENGGWQFTPNPPLNPGEHEFTIIVTDPAGNRSEPSDPYLIVVDTEAPAAPVIKEIIDDQGAVTGPINNGDTTDDAQPKISGTAEAGSTVIVYDRGVEIGRAQADDQGNWSFTPVPPLQNGDHEISAKAQDQAGNISDESNSIGFDLLTGGVPSAPAIVNVIDDVGAITGNIRPGGVTDDTQPTIVGTAKPGHIVTILIDGQAQGTVVADSKGQWSFTPTTALPEGPHAIVAAATDPQGNPMPSSGEYNIVVDTTAPDVGSQSLIDNVGDKTGPIASGDTTDDSTPTYSGVAEPGSTVIIKDGDREIGRVPANSKGEWSFTPTTPLPDGPHSLSHQVQDQAGNLSAASTPIDFVVDTSAVVVSITNVFDDEGSVTGTLQTGSVTDDTTPTLNGRATANALVTIKNGTDVIGSVYADARGNWQFTPAVELKEGQYNFTASAEAKNGSVAVSDKFELTIDITPPDNNGIGDIKDNVGGIVNPIQDGGLTDDTTPELVGSGQEPGDVVTIIDNGKPIGSTVVGDDGSWSYTPETPLPEGSHDFTIIVTDPAGNDSQESDPWTVIVDTKPPVAPSIDSVWDDVDPKQGNVANNGYTNDQRPELRGSAAANAIVIIYQNGIVKASVTADSSGKWKWTPSVNLSDATFNFAASQVSAAGVEGNQSAKYTITVDTVAPNAPVISSVEDNVAGGVVGKIADGGLTNDNKPTLKGSAEANALIIVRVNGNDFASTYATASGDWQIELPTALGQGTQNLSVVAQDQAGNTSPSSNSWTVIVDSIAPNAPAITLAEDNVAGGIVGDLANGGLTNDNTPKLSGTAEANALVFIRVDGGGNFASVYADGSGKWSLELPTALGEGSHQFRAFAQDAAGNLSAQSNQWELTVDTKAPDAPSITKAEDNVAGGIVGDLTNGGVTNDNTPKLRGTAEANALVFIRVDGGGNFASVYADGSGNWSLELPTALGEGSHQFRAFAQDAAGNLSAQSNLWNLTVDTIAPNAPVITNLVDNVPGGIVGDIANGGTTNDNKPTLKGTSEANALITIRVDNVVWGSVRADGNGKWELELTKEISDGSHQIRAFAEDAAGNSSAQSNLWNVVVETTTTHSASVTFTTEPWGYSVGYSYNKNGFGLVKTGRNESDYIQFSGSWIEVDSGPLEVSLLNGQQAKSFTVNTQQQHFTYHYRVYDVKGQFMYEIDSTGNTTLETTSGKAIGKVEISMVPNGRALYFYGFSAEVYDTPVQSTTRSMMMFDHNADDDIAQATAVDEGDKDNDQTDDNSAQTYVENNQLTILHSESVLNFNQLVEPLKDINVVDMTNNENTVLNISVSDLLAHGEEGAFTADDTKQLMIKGDKGDVVNLSDLLPDGTDPGNWAKAEGTVTVGGVQYEVYQHTGAETELLVQLGVQTNLNNH